MPSSVIGMQLKEIGFRKNYNLLVLTTMKTSEEKTDVGRSRNITKVQGVASPELMLEKDDILVVYGSNKDIQAFLKS